MLGDHAQRQVKVKRPLSSHWRILLFAGCLLSAPVLASETDDLLTFDRIAYELAVLDLVEHELELAEPREAWPTPVPDPAKVPRFNPCAHLPPDEPTQLCQCPPMPPWGWCL